jgi:aminoglycoside phosphotransferase family enzyme
MRETHISWVFLTDRFAYKLKKPVRYDFLDFSTPQARRAACEAELRLNQRLARDIYLEVLPIARNLHGRLRWGGSSAPVDWVVKMRRLPADRMLDGLIRSGCLSNTDVDKLASTLARFFHEASPLVIAPGDYRQSLQDHVRGNRRELLAPSHALPAEMTKRIHAAQLRFLELQPDRFDERVCDGRVIEGHGDLRPEHICLLHQPVIFDCIEFNADLRRLDVADELSFLSMECDRLGADWVGDRVIQAYRRISNDPVAEDVLNFYKSYRACVRAKVAALRADQVQPAMPHADPDSLAYLKLADRYAATLGGLFRARMP